MYDKGCFLWTDFSYIVNVYIVDTTVIIMESKESIRNGGICVMKLG